MSDEHVRNLIKGDVPGTSIMGRDISGGISITNVFDERVRLGSDAVSELSVAVPGNATRQRLRGRDDLVAELTLSTTGYIVLAGAGGCGKSALAAEIGERAAADRAVWWVEGTTRDTLVSGLFEVAVQAGVSRAEARDVWRNGESAKDLLWRALRSANAQPWLLIVDNADEPAMLDGWLREPPAGNTVLVTSRDHRPASWARHAVIREVLPISDVDGAAVLTELAPGAGSDDDARRLANRLGGLPLALMLVGTYLGRTGPVLPESRHPRSFAEYTEALDTEFPDTISSLGDQVLERTWERSLDLLESQGVSSARPLFRLLAFYSVPIVPVVLLVSSVLKRAPGLFPDLTVTDLEKAVEGLLAFGLLDHRRAGQVDAFVLHTLIGEITRTQPDARENAGLYRTLRAALLHRAATDHYPPDHATWPVWRLLLPLCTFTDEDLEHVDGDEYLIHAQLAFYASRYATAAGLWATAEEYCETSMTLWSKRVPATDPYVIGLRQNLAYLKLEQGRFAEAESELRDVLDVATATLGADDDTTISARHELARALREQGRYDLAEQEFSALVPRMSEVLGAEHEHTLVARHERARTRRQLGDLEFAQAEVEELVATMTRLLGPDSPRTLTARHELAEILLDQGRLADARAMLRDNLVLESRFQGFDHPNTLTTRFGLAEIDINEGRLDEAEAALRDIVAAWTRAGEERNPRALPAWGAQARILAERGELAAAETEYRAIMAVMTATLGGRHPYTLKVHSAIVNVMVTQGKRAAALGECRTLLAAMIDSSGESHPDVLVVRKVVADLLYKVGDYAEAEVELRRVAFAQSRVLGREHRDTLVTRSEIAAIICKQGKFETARDQLRDLVPRLEHLGGVDDASLTARANLSYAYRYLGDVEAAVRELREILSLCENGEHEAVGAAMRRVLRELTGEH